MTEPAKKVLIIVTSDPRESGRAAEAVRIAAGVGNWEKVAVRLCLCGEACRALLETDELVNGDVFDAYLPLLLEAEGTVLALDADRLECASSPQVRAVTISELAEIGRAAHSVLRF